MILALDNLHFNLNKFIQELHLHLGSFGGQKIQKKIVIVLTIHWGHIL